MTMPHSDSTHTSLAQLFGQSIRGMQVQAIEIPMIQRDYAQGRRSPQVQQIRERFISNLFDALDSPLGIDLDFVFGDVVEKERHTQEHGTQKVPTLYPLDGQQRLSTLFLLHWYLAWYIPETEGVSQPWHAFSYATRPGARAFCQFLTKCRPDMAQRTVSEWLQNQADYLPTWKHDPTIQGMLVMLDALHQRYSAVPQEKRRTHWERLIDPAHPAIRFHLLPIRNSSENNTLYVKMNSRGRPLTEFENFKADLEALMRDNPAIADETKRHFSDRIDTVWADLFWNYRGNNHLIDEEIMRYLRFLAEVRAWQQKLQVNHLSLNDAQELARLAQSLLGPNAEHTGASANWICRALDVWLEEAAPGQHKPRHVRALFEQWFTRASTTATEPLRVFNFRDFDEREIGVDMFHACCNLYGTRSWRLAHTLLLYGVLHGLMAQIPPESFAPRLRLLRNLIEASQDDIRAGERNNMPELLKDVELIMSDGPLADIKAFNQVQVIHEVAKREFLKAHPSLQGTLYHLEDHELLRGGLTVFDLNPAQHANTFAQRAAQFSALFAQPYSQVTGALLTQNHEGRSVKRNAGYRLAYLGAPKQSEPWQNLFRARRGEAPHPSSAALMALLDALATGKTLPAVMTEFIEASDTPKDWRYYMVKYPEMRTGDSGNHVIGPGAGYALVLLKGDYCDYRSYHYDSYLLALAQAAGMTRDQISNEKWPRCFTGDGTSERHLELKRSGIKIQCIEAGWMLSNLPTQADQRSDFDRVASQHGVQDGLYVVPQVNTIDTKDRIALGAELLRDLLTAGL